MKRYGYVCNLSKGQYVIAATKLSFRILPPCFTSELHWRQPILSFQNIFIVLS